MNNLRLLAWLACAAMTGGGTMLRGQTVMTLDEIFAAAEAGSTSMQYMRSAQDEADKEIAVARSGRLPDISTSLSVSYIGDGFTTRRNFTDYQRAPIPHLGTGLSVNVEQPLYTGGAVTSSIELARLKSTAARQATDLRGDDVRFRLTGFYLDIYKNHNLHRVVESSLESAREELERMKARRELGTAISNDITRYELLVANLELQLTKLDNARRILNDNLVTLAGLPGDLVIVPDTAILSRALPRQGEQWWQKQATECAPSLRLASTGVDISRRAEKLAYAERLPKIGLRASWTIDGPILVEIPPINRNLSYWYVGVGVSYNLSSLYKSKSTIARSKAATATAVDRLRMEYENVALEVSAAHVKWLEAYEEVKTEEKSVELAERNYAVTSTRYGEGMALITDMLDAADARLSARTRLVNARIDIIYYYYKLLFISGKI